MPDEFHYDVFLSHSAKDKAVVRPLAERLRTDGICKNSQLSTFNSQPPRGSDWAQLESGTLRTGQRPFRDPLNKERRFLPLRFDDDTVDKTLQSHTKRTRIVAEVERRLSVVKQFVAVVLANLQRATRLRQSILEKAFTRGWVEVERSAQ